MEECKEAPTPIIEQKKDLESPLLDVGNGIIYLSVGGVAQFLQRKRPDTQFAMRAKRFARCLQGTRGVSLFYLRGDKTDRVLERRSDTDWTGCEITRKSVACATFKLGGCLIRSYVRTQNVIAKSSGEAELYGLVDCAQEGILLAAVLKFLRHEVIIECGTDSSAAKAMAERLGVGPRVRHLEVDSLWIQQAVREKHVRLKKGQGRGK